VSVGATVSGVPGPSAVTFSLALAGLPAERFVFEGFLPRKGRARSERVSAITVEPRTVVLFCAPSRLADDLAALAFGAGDRECVVLRELTKLHEEVWRGTVADAAAHWASVPARGEVTVVVGPADHDGPTVDDASARVTALVAGGLSRSEAVRQAAAETGVSRRELYERTIGTP
jgi:16S rRNA (cytidine1402-2'-O)-methyltransferase